MLATVSVQCWGVTEKTWLQCIHEDVFAAPLGFEIGTFRNVRLFQTKGTRVPWEL